MPAANIFRASTIRAPSAIIEVGMGRAPAPRLQSRGVGLLFVWKGLRAALMRGAQARVCVDDLPDLGAAGAAIGSRLRRLADGLHAVATRGDGGGDLVRANAKTRADGRATVEATGAWPRGDDRETAARISEAYRQLFNGPIARDGHGRRGKKQRADEAFTVETGKAMLAARACPDRREDRRQARSQKVMSAKAVQSRAPPASASSRRQPSRHFANAQ